jgi:hypothetical protein
MGKNDLNSAMAHSSHILDSDTRAGCIAQHSAPVCSFHQGTMNGWIQKKKEKIKEGLITVVIHLTSII